MFDIRKICIPKTSCYGKSCLGEVIHDLNPIIIFQSSSMGIYSSVDLFHYFCNLCDFWNYLECHCQLFRWWLFPSTKIWPRFRKMFSIPIHLKALTKQIYISLLKFKKYTQEEPRTKFNSMLHIYFFLFYTHFF